MKAKRRFNIWLWVLLCVPCLLASCDHDVHDGEDEGGLSVSLTWADEADEGTEVKDVKTPCGLTILVDHFLSYLLKFRK